MSIGWITLHRQIIDWQWYTDGNTFRLFVHLLLKATRKPIKWRNIELLPGQMITGRKVLAKELQLSEQEIRTSIDKLKATNEITIKVTNKFSIVTVCKWDTYQHYNSDDQPTNQPASQPTINHIQQVNNLNKSKRVIFTPPSLIEIESYFSQKIKEKGLSLNSNIESEKFEAFYSSKNWMVGKNKMVDWNKSISGWIARTNTTTNEQPKPKNIINLRPEWQ